MKTEPTARRPDGTNDRDGERSEAQAHEHLWELISDMRFAMFTSRNAQGHLCSRPLTTQNTGDKGGSDKLEFFVSARSELPGELAADNRVCVVYADPGKDAYVSVSGRASLRQDLQRQQVLWTKMAQAWFPGGAGDPDLRLLRVDIDAAEYWDIHTSKMVQLLKMATAAVTGKPPTNMGEHREVSMD